MTTGHQAVERGGVLAFLSRRQGGSRLSTADIVTYIYLTLGTILMFGPVLWMLMSSFKPQAALDRFPPTFLPYWQNTVEIEGYDDPALLYDVTFSSGETRRLAQVSESRRVLDLVDPAVPDVIMTYGMDETVRDRIGDVEVPGYDEPLPLFSITFEDGSVRELARVGAPYSVVDMVNPEAAQEIVPVSLRDVERERVESVNFRLDNYINGAQQFDFLTYLSNSVIVTATATFFTLLFNSMAAFGLSKYKYRGRNTIFVVMLATLMVPISVILIPAFLVISRVGWVNNLWGVIIPGAATPTGVFLLRQYMLTIPDELLDSARIDGATEWRIYLQIILPLAAPALAVLAIFSVMWRWNDFLWPLIVLSRTELFTLQVGLNAFQGDLNTQWDYILAMTVLTLLPITLVFAFLQRFITTGIATTGMK